MKDEKMKKEKTWNLYTLSFGLILFAIFILYLVTFQVSIKEVALVTTFGRPSRTIMEPGLYWKAPWPIQEVHHFDRRLQVLDGKIEESFTKDGKNIVLITSTFWQIKDPLKFFTSLGSMEVAKRKLTPIIRSYKHGIIGTYNLSSLINVDEDLLKLDEIQQKIRDFSHRDAVNMYGIEILEVVFQRIQFPAVVTDDIFERMRSERRRISEAHRAEGEGIAIKIKAEADRERERRLSEARAEAKRIRGEGDYKAARFYGVFSKNEELAIFLRKLESLEKTLKGDATVILDHRTPPFDLLMGKPVEEKDKEVK